MNSRYKKVVSSKDDSPVAKAFFLLCLRTKLSIITCSVEYNSVEHNKGSLK